MSNITNQTILDGTGYHICNNDINIIKSIKDDLTVTPLGLDTVPFSVCVSDNPTSITVPKYFGMDKFGVPDITHFDNIDSINVKFHGSLKEIQKPVSTMVLKSLRNSDKGGGICALPCGFGKCFAKDTMIMLGDCSSAPVQSIRPGYKIMGDDGTTRIVKSTCIGTECDSMYRIYSTDMQYCVNYVVNSEHIVCTIDKYDIKHDIPIKKVIEMIDSGISVFGYNNQIDNKSPFPLSAEQGQIDAKYSLCIHKYINFSLSDKLTYLRGIINELGGLFSHNTNFNFNTSDYGILEGRWCFDNRDIVMDIRNFVYAKYVLKLARSCGLVAYTCNNKIYIKNDIRKRFVYKIGINKEDMGTYYGFTINGNGRFLLDNCTVVHNTVLSIHTICSMNVKTLIIVHKTFLQDQWIDSIKTFAPSARIGIIKQNNVDVKDKDIVIAMVQSLSMRQYDIDTFKGFGMIIVDECHRVGSKVFSTAFQKCVTKYTLGLSATPNRIDGMSKVFKWSLGPIICHATRKINDNIDVVMFWYKSTSNLFVRKTMNRQGKQMTCLPKMITNLSNIKSRCKFIRTIIIELLKQSDRYILLLSDRLKFLRDMNDILGDDSAMYVGGMKKKELLISSNARCICATYAMASEGLDIKSLNTLVLTSPKNKIEQAVGRILRKSLMQGDAKPLIIDICDVLQGVTKFSVNHENYYIKCGYNIKVYPALNSKCVNIGTFLSNNCENMSQKDYIIALRGIRYYNKYNKCNTGFDIKEAYPLVNEPILETILGDISHVTSISNAKRFDIKFDL